MLSKDKNQINTTKKIFLVDNTRYIKFLQKQTKTRRKNLKTRTIKPKT